MSVVSVKELHQRRRSSYRDGQGETHVRAFLVVTDNSTDGTRVAMVANDGTTRIPGPKEELAGNPFITATSIEAQPVQESDRVFEVTVEYTSTQGDETQTDVNPLDRPPEVSWTNNEGTEPYFIDETPGTPQVARDLSGNPITYPDGTFVIVGPGRPVVNTAGDGFDQFMERETAGAMIITIVRNEPYHDATEAEYFSHTVNTDNVLIDGTVFPAGTLKLSPIQASRVVEVVTTNGVAEELTYYRRTYTIKYRRDGWRDYPLDVGTNEIVSETKTVNGKTVITKKLRPIVDNIGHRVTKPWPLDGQGRKLPNPTDIPPALEFLPYREVSWGPLYFS